jgi:hypothetical protein
MEQEATALKSYSEWGDEEQQNLFETAVSRFWVRQNDACSCKKLDVLAKQVQSVGAWTLVAQLLGNTLLEVERQQRDAFLRPLHSAPAEPRRRCVLLL